MEWIQRHEELLRRQEELEAELEEVEAELEAMESRPVRRGRFRLIKGTGVAAFGLWLIDSIRPRHAVAAAAGVATLSAGLVIFGTVGPKPPPPAVGEPARIGAPAYGEASEAPRDESLRLQDPPPAAGEEAEAVLSPPEAPPPPLIPDPPPGDLGPTPEPTATATPTPSPSPTSADACREVQDRPVSGGREPGEGSSVDDCIRSLFE